MKIGKTKNVKGLISDRAVVKVTDAGCQREVRYVKFTRKKGLGVRKVSKNEYVDEESGEVFKVKHSENRKGNVDALRKTFKRLRDLINCNFSGASNELFMTLTYADNMIDVKQLYKDFDKFWKRFKYKYGKAVEYISVVEPQARGAWHCHVLVKFKELDKVYIDNKELAQLWGHGFVNVRRIKGCDNVGAYLTAYLGDIELNDENSDYIAKELKDGVFELKEVEVDGKKKSFIKGGRLHMYPTGMNIYRSSRGLKRPEVRECAYATFKMNMPEDAEPYFTECIVIGLEDETADNAIRECNRIVYERYKIDDVGFWVTDYVNSDDNPFNEIE